MIELISLKSRASFVARLASLSSVEELDGDEYG